MSFLIIALPSLLVVMIMKLAFSHTISTKEFFIHIGIVLLGVLLCIASTYGVLYSTMADTEILNGRVQSKGIHKESCGSGSSCTEYHWREKCHYSKDSNGKRVKHCTSYKVYHYPYEFFYNVNTTIGGYTIDRVDDQGVKTPPRFDMIKIGDIASTTHYYTNYILGNKDSLFYKWGDDTVLNNEAQMKKIPDYPNIVDYYNVNRVINSSGFSVPIVPAQEVLDTTLSTLGAEKQVNVLVILYNHEDTNFVKRTLIKWSGGKKNDVLMFFGIDKDATVRYFSSTSYAEGMNNAELHSTLRMNNLDKKFNADLVSQDLDVVRLKFSRLPAKEFEYLKLNMTPSLSALIISSILCMLMSIALGYFLHREEVA